MKIKLSYSLFIFMTGIFTGLFGHDFQSKVISDSLECVHEIVTEAPEIIKLHSRDKVYLNESNIYPMGEKTYLLLKNGQSFPVHSSFIFADHFGPYLSLSREVLAKKPFKNVCYNCKYEWEGGFALRCPRCKSTDIGNEPS